MLLNLVIYFYKLFYSKRKGGTSMSDKANGTLKNLCRILSGSFHLPIFFVLPNGDISFEVIGDRILNPLYKNDKQLLFTLLDFNPKEYYNFPVIKKTHLYENYLLISVIDNKQFVGTIIIGPSLPYALFEHTITGLINDFHVFAKKEQVFHYFKSLPIIESERLLNISAIAYHLINNILLPIKWIEEENKQFFHKTIDYDINLVKSTANNPVDPAAMHHNPLLEKQLLSIIKEGHIEELKNFTKLGVENTGVLSKSSYIRSRKNIGIAGITLATRAAIEGGVHPEVAFTLSDLFIQRLEDMNSIQDLEKVQLEAFFAFTNNVLKIKTSQNSKTITKCKNYIYNNRYEKISHEDVANIAELSPSYFSVLFKKEIGLSVSEYIQKVKIDEAKNLLEYTNTPLSEICSLLNFSDQSYFTKVFKKHTKMTPKQYKENYHLDNK